MKRKIACFAAVLCLLLSAATLPGLFVLAEEDLLPSTETVSPGLTPVEVVLTLQVSGDRVDIAVMTSDGSLPVGLPVVLTVDGETAAEGVFIDDSITLLYSMAKGDRVYRVYTEDFEVGGKLYSAAMTEVAVDYNDHFLSVDFFRADNFHFDSRLGVFELEWNYDSYGNMHGADVVEVLLGGRSVNFTGEKGTLSADLSGFANGVYALELVLGAGALTAAVDMGEVRLSMDIQPVLTAELTEDGRICVTVKDKWGNPLYNIPVTMRVGGTDYLPVRTDESGRSYFNKPAGDAKISFLTNETHGDGYLVLVGTVLFGETTDVTVPPVVGSTTETTGTTKTTRPPVTTARTTTPVTETTSPYPTVTASPTTGVSTDGMVALGVTYEQMLESLLGVTAEQMSELGRVYLSADLYDMYVTDTKSSLSLLVRAQEVSVGDRELGMSLQNGGLGNNGKDAYRICLKLSLLLTVDGSATEMPMLDGNYVVQLPVPEAMLSADGCAVAFYDVQNGLQKAEAVTPVEGYIRFVIKQEGTYALIGVYESAQGGGLFWPILVIVFGCLLVVCGALLVWLRFSGAAVVAGMLGGKPSKEAAAEEAVAEPTPAAVADEVIAAAAPAAVAAPAAEEEYEDIFSSAERRDAFNKRDE